VNSFFSFAHPNETIVEATGDDPLQKHTLLFSRASLSGRVVLATGTGGAVPVVFDSSAISAFVEKAQLTPELESSGWRRMTG
jgi:hypothetical protein